MSAMGTVERKGDIPNLSFKQLTNSTPRCPHCGARNPHGTACQNKPKK
jgi:hypothetical protein